MDIYQDSKNYNSEKYYGDELYYKKLVEKYSDGRGICNCGNAYTLNCGKASIFDEKLNKRIDVEDYPVCPHGCSAAQIITRNYIARRICEDFFKEQF